MAVLWCVSGPVDLHLAFLGLVKPHIDFHDRLSEQKSGWFIRSNPKILRQEVGPSNLPAQHMYTACLSCGGEDPPLGEKTLCT